MKNIILLLICFLVVCCTTKSVLKNIDCPCKVTDTTNTFRGETITVKNYRGDTFTILSKDLTESDKQKLYDK